MAKRGTKPKHANIVYYRTGLDWVIRNSSKKSKMPVVQNIGRRFQWTQPCFGIIGPHTAAKIMVIIDFIWSVFGFFSTFLYGLYWYDITDLQKLAEDPETIVLKFVDGDTVVHYYFQPMAVSGLMILLFGFGATTFMTYILSRRFQKGNCAPYSTWQYIFRSTFVLRPFAFLFIISLLKIEYTENLFLIAFVISILYTVYGSWIISCCKNKILSTRPLISYEEV